MLHWIGSKLCTDSSTVNSCLFCIKFIQKREKRAKANPRLWCSYEILVVISPSSLNSNFLNSELYVLELTSLDDPHVLECAAIITDKNLNELERGHWMIHFEKEELEKLSDFHKKTFKSRADGTIS